MLGKARQRVQGGVPITDLPRSSLIMETLIAARLLITWKYFQFLQVFLSALLVIATMLKSRVLKKETT